MSSTSKLLLKSLKTFSFRNIDSLSIELHHKNNIFIGQNGQGKTNCLEAISQIISLRSLQTLKNDDLIKRGGQKSRIEAEITGDLNLDIAIEIFKVGKKGFINQKPIQSAKVICNSFSVVSFIPSELNMVNGSPSLRRLAIDQAAASLLPAHMSELRDYEKALANRNSCLKKSWPLDKDVLQAFTELMIEKSINVTTNRINTIKILKPFFWANIKNILDKNTDGDISYHLHGNDNCIDTSQVIENLKNAATKLEKEEFFRKTSLIGCHLDDIRFQLNDMCAQKRASRGECRSLVFALKISQMQAIQNLLQRSPMVILDDLPSELDKDRIEGMMAIISDLAGQTFYSSVDKDFFTFDSCAIFDVRSGMVNTI